MSNKALRAGVVALAALAAAVLFAPGWLLDLPDPGVTWVGFRNVEEVRRGLDTIRAKVFASEHTTVHGYPVGGFDYAEFANAFPDFCFPEKAEDAGWKSGSFLYSSIDGESYRLTVQIDNERQSLVVATPEGMDQPKPPPAVMGDYGKYSFVGDCQK